MVQGSLRRINVGKDFAVRFELRCFTGGLVELAFQFRVGLEQLAEVGVVRDHLTEKFGGDNGLKFQLKVLFFAARGLPALADSGASAGGSDGSATTTVSSTTAGGSPQGEESPPASL